MRDQNPLVDISHGYKGNPAGKAEVFNTDALERIAKLDAEQRAAEAQDQTPTWVEQVVSWWRRVRG